MKSSLAALLAEHIESFAARLRTSHPLLAAAESGELSADTVATYLMNVRFMVSLTPVHLGAARQRCEELGQRELAEFFGQKLVEETGHDRWADADLSRLHEVFGVAPKREPSRHLQDLAHYLERVISEGPSRYVAYALLVEYLILLLGPIWMSALCERCNIPPDALTVISNHVELDGGHVADELREIDHLLRGEDPAAYEDVMHRSMRLLERFYDELLETNRQSANASTVAAE
jgi:pyrroloquinoline quinone (PQQ) biosynthesis protein C